MLLGHVRNQDCSYLYFVEEDGAEGSEDPAATGAACATRVGVELRVMAGRQH